MANKDKIEKLEDLIKDSIQGELVEQTVSSLLPPGENYGSVIYKVDFKVRKDGEEQEYHAVAKCTPPNQVTQAVFNTQETFKAEIGWYTTVIPTLKKFAKDQGLERQLDFFQNFYGARISLDPHSEKVDLDGVILTENLKYLGYKNIDRHVGFDMITTHSILRDLAAFHAVPLALRELNMERYNEDIKPYLPTWSFCSKEIENDFKKDVFKIYNEIPEVSSNKSLTERIRKRVENSVIFGHREYREPWVTAQHMDFWSNNIMVTESDRPKTMILDLQCPGYGSPAADLVFFLLTSVEADVIEKSFDYLVKFYHDELIKCLDQLKVQTIDKFCYEGLLRELDEEVRGGELVHALVHLYFILGEKGVTTLDARDANFQYEDLTASSIDINERHIAKYRWLTGEAEKRHWF